MTGGGNSRDAALLCASHASKLRPSSAPVGWQPSPLLPALLLVLAVAVALPARRKGGARALPPASGVRGRASMASTCMASTCIASTCASSEASAAAAASEVGEAARGEAARGEAARAGGAEVLTAGTGVAVT